MATPLTFAQIYDLLNTDLAATLYSTPEPVRTNVGSSTISLTNGATTIQLFNIQGGFLFPNETIYDPITQTFNVTGVATSCSVVLSFGTLTCTTTYTGTTGAVTETLTFISCSSYQLNIVYAGLDTGYSVNNGTVSVISQPSTGKTMNYVMPSSTVISSLNMY